MNDDELERRLRAYRPVNPPEALRARVAASGAKVVQPGGRGIVAWLPAVAAVLIASVFYWLAAVQRQRLDVRLPQIPPIEQQFVNMEEPQ